VVVRREDKKKNTAETWLGQSVNFILENYCFKKRKRIRQKEHYSIHAVTLAALCHRSTQANVFVGGAN
jgi:hypothetical protein